MEAVPFLLARSEAFRSLKEASKSLEDPLAAKQLDPTNPEVSAQVHNSIREAKCVLACSSDH